MARTRELLRSGSAAQPAEESTQPPARPQPSPNPYQPGADRIRQTATWLVGALAAVATVMLAGSQLSGIGALSATTDTLRLSIAVTSAVLAVGAVSYAVVKLTEIQMPREGTLGLIRESARTSSRLRELAAGDSGLRAGRPDVERFLDDYEELRRLEWAAEAAVARCEADVAAARTPKAAASAASALAAAKSSLGRATRERAALSPNVVQLVQLSSYLAVRERFEHDRPKILAAAIITAVLLVSFAWAANPPKPIPGAPDAIPAQPMAGRLTLTPDGRTALEGILGSGCANAAAATGVPVLALASTSSDVEVVLVPQGSCPTPVRLTVPHDRGYVVASPVDLER